MCCMESIIHFAGVFFLEIRKEFQILLFLIFRLQLKLFKIHVSAVNFPAAKNVKKELKAHAYDRTCQRIN